MLAIILLILLQPTADEDGDGYNNLRETLNRCDPLDADNFPVCQHGEVVACSLDAPGFTPPVEIC